jgi:large subunit ribosomal protein L3
MQQNEHILQYKHQPRPIAGGNGEKMNQELDQGQGLVGRKVGMMRIFTDEGDSIPVTVLDVSNNRVTQIKLPETDGYTAVQVAFGARRASRVNKASAGHHAKAGVEAGTTLVEFRITSARAAELKLGDVIAASLFEVGQKVDVQGTSIGKGYAGVIKRYNFSSGRATHGNSRSHNVPGSIGMAQDPGRVFPGKRMTGHMGDVTVTTQNLEIARIDGERQLLMIKGAVPGAKNGQVVVRNAIKTKAKKGA